MEARPIVTQAWLADIASMQRAAELLQGVAKQHWDTVLSMIEAGARIEPGRLQVRITTRWGRRILDRKMAPVAPPTDPGSGMTAVIVTQQQLQRIADLEDAAKFLLEGLKEKRRPVLEAVQAGAPVEPGRFKVHIRTRWRRRKAS